MDLSRAKEIEKAHFEQKRDGAGPLPLVVVEEVQRRDLQPCFTTGSDRYSDNKMAFHRLIHREGGWEGKTVLDYACGNGLWATYFALTGARKVVGFDLAESGIRRGRERLAAQGLTGKVDLLVMDATDLTFADASFDMVVGTAVLHHVLKYPNVFEHLHRVMKPGAKAFFLENLADFPLFKLWWTLKGPVESGDIPLFAKDLRERTQMFSRTTITGDTLLFSAKTFLCRGNIGALTRALLRTCKAIDEAAFRVLPPLRAWGSFCYIVLEK